MDNKVVRGIETAPTLLESTGQAARILVQIIWRVMLDGDTNGAVGLKAQHKGKQKQEQKEAKIARSRARKGKGRHRW